MSDDDCTCRAVQAGPMFAERRGDHHAEGCPMYEGDASLSGILGLLDIVKARLLRDAEGW